MFNNKLPLMAIIGICLSQSTQAQSFDGKYPETKKGDQKDEYFGKIVEDPYRWLEDDLSEETAQWVKQQNTLTKSYLEKIPFRSKIKSRLTELWNYERYSAPFNEGGWEYFYKNDGLQNQSVLYRQRPKAGSKPEVFLDPNKFSKEGTSSLAGISFTKDGSLAAIEISEGGSDWTKIVVISAVTKQQIGDTIFNVKFSAVSWRQNEGFYYSSYDKPEAGSALSAKNQNHKLFFHKMGTRQPADQLIFGGEKMPRRYVVGSVTEDQKYLAISAANTTSGNELYIQEIGQSEIIQIKEGFEADCNLAYTEGKNLYFVTDLGAPNRKVVVANFANPKSDNWKDLIPEKPYPLSLSTGGGKFFVSFLKDAVSQVERYSIAGQLESSIQLPGLGTASGFSGKMNEKQIYYTFTSYVYPSTIFKYDIPSGKSSLYKKSGVRLDPEQFESRQVFYPSKDGTRVPLIITGKKGFELNSKNPVMLYGYGGFNINLTPSFNLSTAVFMENGGLYAVANLRGGGEYGKEWHDAGTKLKKQNVFDDFIAAAEYLITEKYTSKDFLAISGGSNGGLLVGACLTQRPDLFKVCFPVVGVLDMLRYHQFTAGAGWAYDYGTAQDSKEMFEYLLNYSPVHNTHSGTCYPATMIGTADHDDRVVPAHSFKFASALQAAQSCLKPTLIRIDVNAGHGAGKSTAMIIEEQTDKWAFLLWNMGLDYK